MDKQYSRQIPESRRPSSAALRAIYLSASPFERPELLEQAEQSRILAAHHAANVAERNRLRLEYMVQSNQTTAPTHFDTDRRPRVVVFPPFKGY